MSFAFALHNFHVVVIFIVDSSLETLDRIEYISADYLLEPDHLPLAYTGHCLIRITDETLVLTGGKNGMEVNQM